MWAYVVRFQNGFEIGVNAENAISACEIICSEYRQIGQQEMIVTNENGLSIKFEVDQQ